MTTRAAGEFAFAAFALGIVGTGLLAVPVLASSAAYAVCELYGWKAGLSRGFNDAKGFYLIIVAATGIGTLMGHYTISLRHRWFGWAATAVMAVAVLVMLVTGF